MPTAKLPQSIFPDYPHEAVAITQGKFTSPWALSLQSLYQALQRNFKNEGILFPPLTAAQIATIQAIYTSYIGLPLPANIPDISGQTVFDSTNRVPKQFIITYSGTNVATARWWTFTMT